MIGLLQFFGLILKENFRCLFDTYMSNEEQIKLTTLHHPKIQND